MPSRWPVLLATNEDEFAVSLILFILPITL
jgi:hypothetical protein